MTCIRNVVNHSDIHAHLVVSGLPRKRRVLEHDLAALRFFTLTPIRQRSWHIPVPFFVMNRGPKSK